MLNLKLLFIIVCIFLENLFSQDIYINIWLKNGTSKKFPINEVSKITFDLSTSTETEDIEKIKNVFAIFQNYPNPFNSTTKIEYLLPKNGNVEILIYDITGRFIKRWKYENQVQGLYTIEWDGTNELNRKVSSGIYIYMINYQNMTISKKLILLK